MLSIKLDLEVPSLPNVHHDPVLNARPFLRWAGSKRKLLKYLVPYIPANYGKYYEPFLGSGAMFFFLGPASAEVSDASPALIATYRAVRKNAAEIIRHLHPLRPNRKTFDLIRKLKPRTEAKAAATFIFLNKSCWNGLYRVNSQGIFNVPFGAPKTDFVIDHENFKACAQQLRRRSISIRHQDFEAIAPRVRAGDFVYLDPPYVTSHNMNGFVDWNESLFGWKDQVRLSKMARMLVGRGANVLISNAAHQDVKELYYDFGQVEFERYSTLASDTTKRKKTSEAVFFGGPAYAHGPVREYTQQVTPWLPQLLSN